MAEADKTAVAADPESPEAIIAAIRAGIKAGTLQVEDKQAIIAYVMDLQQAPNPGGLSLGRLGPVSEGLFLWAGAMAAFVGLAVWIGIKAR